jgi:lipoprotein-releasing system permease protein
VFEAHSLEGFPDPEWHMQQIRNVGGDDVVGMTPTVTVPAMLSFQYGGNWVTRPVQLIGIDERTQGDVSDFGKYLQHPENRKQLSFQLRECGYDQRDHTGGDEGRPRPELGKAGWGYRRAAITERRTRQAEAEKMGIKQNQEVVPDDPFKLGETEQPKDPAAAEKTTQVDPFAAHRKQGEVFDPLREQHTGLVMGIALATFRDRAGDDRFLVLPGDDVKITFPTAGTPPRAIDDAVTVVDFFECKMSEYDQSFVFMPLKEVQKLRGMIEPKSGLSYATSIQIRLRPGADAAAVRDRLREVFRPDWYSVSTWRDKQGALLAAVQMETAILNLLLFMIIAVAGFGILAIFFMIVVEKTRDIGILKSLGASGRGIMGIFLGYGLSLGLVGAGAGLTIGLLLVFNINQVANLLGWITGTPVFDPSIYYFYKIPTVIDPWTVTWIVTGALVIAVLASVLPARRAARLHPVEALRYE